jgi:hypothetical protein
MKSGCANCSTLFSIDTHELPLGSIPPVAPALAISSAGFAPNATDDKTARKAMIITIPTVRSARLGWRLSQKRCAGSMQMELIGVFSFDDEHSTRIMFDDFISAGALLRQDKLYYLIEWRRLTLVLYQSHIPSRQTGGKGIGLPSFDVQSFSRRTGTGLIGINPGGNDVLAWRQITTVASALGKASHILAVD